MILEPPPLSTQVGPSWSKNAILAIVEYHQGGPSSSPTSSCPYHAQHWAFLPQSLRGMMTDTNNDLEPPPPSIFSIDEHNVNDDHDSSVLVLAGHVAFADHSCWQHSLLLDDEITTTTTTTTSVLAIPTPSKTTSLLKENDNGIMVQSPKRHRPEEDSLPAPRSSSAWSLLRPSSQQKNINTAEMMVLEERKTKKDNSSNNNHRSSSTSLSNSLLLMVALVRNAVLA